MEVQKGEKELWLLTASFPYGRSETFLESELPYLAKRFPRVVIISNAYDFSECREVPKNVEVVHFPYFLTFSEKIASLAAIFSPLFYQEWRNILFKWKTRPNRWILPTLLVSWYKGRKLALFLEKLLKDKNSNPALVTAYSYWCNDMALGLALFRKKYPGLKAISRAHGWDVYFEVNQAGYLPFRPFLFNHLNVLVFISEFGRKYTQEKFGKGFSADFIISRLGTENPSPWQPRQLRSHFLIVSCSNLIPLKRIGLLIEALALTSDLSWHWIHFGDGVLRTSLEAQAKKQLNPTSYEFKGRVPNAEVLAFYAANTHDLLVNVSNSEGVPVSIMEAFSFGIPVLATNVGGNREIVDSTNGLLLEKNPTAEDVAVAIRQLLKAPLEDRNKMSLAAYTTWEKQYKAGMNYSEFTDWLGEL